MGLFSKKKKVLEEASLSDLSDAERREAIDSVERMRDDVIFSLEQIMAKIADAGRGRMKRLKRRRHKLGKAPNDERP